MKYIVTGGSGMVGKHLQKLMPELTYLSSKDCDLTNEQEVKKLFADHRPDGVIHLAARVGGILENMKYPADFYDQNIKINSNVLIACREHGVKKMLSILSTCMYPDIVEQYPMTEGDFHKGPPAKANFSYAYTKRCMAVQIDAYKSQDGLDYNYLIPCNLYGEYDNFTDLTKSHFITALIKKIIIAEEKGEKSISLFGTGRPLRQFMHTEDLARVIQYVIENDISESFNVAPPNQNFSIDEMARITLQTLGKTDWRIDYDSEKPDGQYRKDVSCEKMLKHLPNFNFLPLHEGVLRVYNSLKKS